MVKKKTLASAGDITDMDLMDWEDPLEKGITTHRSNFAWRIPCTEQPGGLESMEL